MGLKLKVLTSKAEPQMLAIVKNEEFGEDDLEKKLKV